MVSGRIYTRVNILRDYVYLILYCMTDDVPQRRRE